jgi:exodeoxyribonuclease V alpha subunit
MPHERTLGLLQRDQQLHRLRPLDVALARFIAERDPHGPSALPWLAAVLSRQLADGHLCLDLTALEALADEQDWPAHWRQAQAELGDGHALLASPLVAGRDGLPLDAPLVLDGPRLYLRRYWNHERQVAAAIRQRLQPTHPVPDALAAELARLFPATATGLPDWPKIACALAARGSFTVITGGPGTGKTTTVVRLLGLLQTLHLRDQPHPLRIRLAAPTGKAAARLNASIAEQLARLDVDWATRDAIPAQVETLHRLLGARPDTRRFRHDQGHPLHLDVLVIDEASMIDLEMMSAVLAALPASARLILLGDKDQLSSVEAGAALGDLCQRAEVGHYSDDTAAWLRSITGDDIRPFVRADARPLDQHVAMLRYSHRFAETSGIGQLAQAVNAGDIARITNLLETPCTDLAWVRAASSTEVAELAIDGGGARFTRDGTAASCGYRHYLEQLRQRRPDADAGPAAHDEWARNVLQAFNRFQLLCALRRGPQGVEGLNQLISAALQAQGLIEASSGWYEGRPVMVTRNDYALGLANGDVGICLRTPDDHGQLRLAVVFLASGGDGSGTRVRHVAPSRLGEVATTYAMTVHKSQGSEFEHTALVLPAETSPVLTRELLYTGITRARRWFSLLGSEATLADAAARRTRRHSGLAERLAEDVHDQSGSASPFG